MTTCTKPLDGYRTKSGKVLIVPRGSFPPRDSLTKVAMPIPCQKCIGCLMEKARQWGIRCLHEKKMWENNSYVTLTYNNDHMPPGMSLSVRDVQLFMKRLRQKKVRDALELGAKAAGRKLRGSERVALASAARVRFFLGAEYGDENARPHYHLLLFNCGFHDRVFFGRNKRGEPLYTSAELSALWSVDGQELGFCTIGEVTYDSAVYCAKYALKRVTGDPAYAHYQVYDEDGRLFNREPEFALMSGKPGIGGTYFDKYGKEALDHDNVIIEGRPCKPPRYYEIRGREKLCSHDEGAILCKCQSCKNKRVAKRKAVLNRLDNTPERLKVKERLLEIAAEKKERKL